MAKFNIDFTEAKEFTMCGKGEHDFKITNAILKDYTKDGEIRQKIELTCEVFGGEDSGAKVFHHIFLKNATGLYMFLSKLGIAVEKKIYNDLDTNMFIGKLFTANVEVEMYQKSDGTTGSKAVLVDTTIRKYVNNNATLSLDDPYADFGDSVSIDDNFLD